MSCFMLRTKSPPDISSAYQRVQVLAGRPSVRERHEPGIGGGGSSGSPASSSATLSSWTSCSTAATARAPAASGTSAARRRRRARASNVNTDANAGALGSGRGRRSSPARMPRRRGDRTRGTCRASRFACVGERPPVHVAPRLEHPQHPVELARQGLGAAADVAARSRSTLAARSARPAAVRRRCATGVGAVRHWMRSDRVATPLGTPSLRPATPTMPSSEVLAARSACGDRPRKAVLFGIVRRRELTSPTARGGSSKSSGPSLSTATVLR